MPVCHEKKFIFLHIPKCAGTSVEDFFTLRRRDCLYGIKKQGSQFLTLHHLTGPQLINLGLLKASTARDYFKFTIIRDPFERMTSDFVWHQQYDRHGEFTGLSFASYLKRAESIIKEERYCEKLHYDHFRPMVDYCFDGNELWVDDILLLDRLASDLARLAPRLGPVNLDFINRGPDRDELRTRSNRRKVYELYQADKQLHDTIAALNHC